MGRSRKSELNTGQTARVFVGTLKDGQNEHYCMKHGSRALDSELIFQIALRGSGLRRYCTTGGGMLYLLTSAHPEIGVFPSCHRERKVRRLDAAISYRQRQYWMRLPH